MSYFAEKRKYQRCNCVVCKALISVNETKWDTVELHDLSAGGLSFYTNESFNEKSILHFNLYVYNMLSEFNIRLDGTVIRSERSRGRNLIAIRFDNINKYQQVQLDELVRSRVTVRNATEQMVHEEELSIYLFSRPRSRKIRISNYK